MRIVLGLETFGNRASPTARQQITPDINFTCDGLITKWIIGAGWVNRGNSYPELQVWRKVGNGVYNKMNGTVIDITMPISMRIYEYDTFSPIPVLAGDILGVFQPGNDISQLGVWSERDNGPLTYYLPTDDTATQSPYVYIYLQAMGSQIYHPLVTVQMSKLLPVFPKWFIIYMYILPTVVSSPTSSVSLPIITDSMSAASTASDKMVILKLLWFFLYIA